MGDSVGPSAPVANSGSLLSIRSFPSGSGVTLEVAGEIDSSTGPQLAAACRSAVQEHGDVVVDLGSVTFCDSSGIRALLSLGPAAEDLGGTVRVVHISAPLQRILDGLNLTARFVP